MLATSGASERFRLDLYERSPATSFIRAAAETPWGLPAAFDDETIDPVRCGEALLVALPAGHRLLGLGRSLDGTDLSNEPMIMYSVAKARYFYDLVVSLIPVAHENVVHSVSQILTMMWLVAAGRGIAIVPASAARLGIAGVKFAALHTPMRDPVELHALWLRESRNPALWQALRVLEQSYPA